MMLVLRPWGTLHDWISLLRIDRPVGYWLLLWPTLWGLLAASNGQPELKHLIVFVAGVFLSYGLEQLQYFFSTGAELFGFVTLISYAFPFGILDFFMQTLLGLGMIIWLLEDERKVVVKTSESLRKSEQRFQSLFEDLPVSIWEEDLSDPKTYIDSLELADNCNFAAYLEAHPKVVKKCLEKVKIVNMNRASLTLLKAQSKNELRQGIENLFTESYYEAFKRELIAARNQETRLDLETTIKTLDGSQLEIVLSWAVVPGYEKTLSRVLVTISDITERKRTEELVFNIAKGVSAATGDTFFRSLVKHLADALNADYAFIGVYEKKPVEQVTTIVVYADGKMADNITYELADSPCENVVGQKLRCYPDSVQQLFPRDHLLVKMEVEAYAGAPLFDSTGKALGLMVVLFRQPLNNPEFAESLLRIFAVRASAELERNQTEETIRESEKQFRDLFESSPDAIFVEDLEGNVLDANPAAGQLHGIDHQELVGKNIIDLVPPEKSEIAVKEFHKLVKGDINYIEGLSRTQKGQDVPVEIHANHISYAGKPALLMLVRDITERKKAEHEKQVMEAQLRQAQKLETVGRLAGGIAHDLNNILMPIL
ncbi:MAG: PAS domain S-box protein [bacterium]